MAILPQNIQARAEQAGKDLVRYAEDTTNKLNSAIQTTKNISIQDGFSSVESGIKDVENAITGTIAKFKKQPTSNLSNSSSAPTGPIENFLGQFKTFNYIFTLGCLTNDEVNFPDSTYRVNGPSVVLLRSGGTGNNQVKTAYEKELGITTEYFIDNISIDTIIAPTPGTKQTNATGLNFEVMEPYSIGMFLQAMQVAVGQIQMRDSARYHTPQQAWAI